MAPSFHENDYLSWYIPLMRGPLDSVNFHGSGVDAVPPGELSLPPQVDPHADPILFERALARWLGLETEELVYTPGATGGTLLALLTLAGRGGKALVERPIYEPMLRQAERLCEVARFDRRARDGWGLPLEELDRELERGADIVVITEPHNPSGRLAPEGQVETLAGMCRDRGAFLLVSEIYLKFTGAASNHRRTPNTVVVSSLSKLMGAYWARLGWLSGEPETVARLRIGHWNMGMPVTPGARAGVGFLSRADELVGRAAGLMRGGLDKVDDFVRSTPGLGWVRPDGAGFGCVSLPGGVDDLAFAERLNSTRGVLVIPGTWFERSGTFRLAWMQAGDRLEEGLESIAAFVAQIS